MLVSSMVSMILDMQSDDSHCASVLSPAGPIFALPQSTATSMKEKKYEEQIQDLQFQLLYGETGKDIQLTKVTEQYLAQQTAFDHERREHAEAKQTTARSREAKVEEWIMQRGAFTASM
jgi:hypothetical protein